MKAILIAAWCVLAVSYALIPRAIAQHANMEEIPAGSPQAQPDTMRPLFLRGASERGHRIDSVAPSC